MGILTGVPCAEEVEKKIIDSAVGAFFRGLKYMFCYKSLVKDRDSKIEKLNNEKEKISRRVLEENDNGKSINEDVLTWLTDVEGVSNKDKDLSPSFSFRCIQCLPIPNPVSRLRLGREAVKKSEIVMELTASGKELSDKDKDIAHVPRRSQDVPNRNTVFQDFPSRKEAYGKLWGQLVSEDSPILGIYGMPGVGKTRMMEQIWQEALEKKIFRKVTLAVVGSVTFDVIKLQDQLASFLKCKLDSEDNSKNRADQLRRSMMNSGKILFIFDDVWGEISLEDVIGTSFNVLSSKSDPGRLDDGNSWNGCKILFTSRLQYHCLNNKCSDPVKITKLKDEEALAMFKDISLDTDQTDFLPNESLVKQVCMKCAGLPLIIYAVGKALKYKKSYLWEHALAQLANCEMENIDGIDPDAYACLKLSFINLSKEAKQCLLLCSLLTADFFINIDMLVDMAAGSKLVQGGRRGLLAAVETLKSASLLLVTEDAEGFRLHDIIRDVARSIAVKDHAFFFERCERWMPGNSADYATGKVMHLELEKDDFSFPHKMVCPDLHTIWLVGINPRPKNLQEQPCKIVIPIFPEGMFSNLGFLMLESFYWEQHLCLLPLNKLKTLILASCNIAYTDFSDFPETLETLCIWNCVLPRHQNFAKLINLRKLDVIGGNKLHMVPNTICSLTRLEELQLQISYWDAFTQKLVPGFSEISKLTSLTSLTICWSDLESSQDTRIFHKLVKFNIRVGVFNRGLIPPVYHSTTRRVELSGKLQFEGFLNLVERAEEVLLRNINVNINKIWNSKEGAFEDLRMLYIEDCDTIEYLASISLYESRCISPQRTSFSNLSSLDMKNCPAMKYLFDNFVAECLVQLQELRVVNCKRMEVIVMNEGKTGRHLINFPKLKTMELLYLPNLKSFYRENKDIHSSSTSMMDLSFTPSVQPQPLFDGMVAFPSLVVLEIIGLHDEVSDIWAKNYYHNDIVSSFWNLKRLKVSSCSGLKNVFQHSPMASHLIMHLKDMVVSHCEKMRQIITTGEQEEIPNDGIIVFTELTKLKLINLPNLSSLWCFKSGEADNCKITFPVLAKFTVEDLEIDLQLIELGGDDSTCQLAHLNLSCNKETQLPTAWQPQLYDLKSLTLRHCFPDVLISLCFFRRLKLLKITELKCSTLFPLSVLRSLQQLQELKISNCIMLEGIVDGASSEVSGRDKKTICTLFNLRSVSLEQLPNLKSFVHNASYELHMPALVGALVANCGLSTLFTCSVLQKLEKLEVLTVADCKLLEGIIADTRVIETCDPNNKIIEVPQLSVVELQNLPNLKGFIHSANYEIHMPALKKVRVAKCGPSTLFTCSVFKNLKQLRELYVFDCKLLESIVVDERGDETSETDDKIIKLSQLIHIYIGSLPKLKSFSPAESYSFDMPGLRNFTHDRCPNLEYFTSLTTSTGRVMVYSEWHAGKGVTDLNKYIREHHNDFDLAKHQPLELSLDLAKHQPLELSLLSFAWSCPWAC